MKTTLFWTRCLAIANVALLFVTSALGAPRTWDGGGSDNNWLTAANWDGDVTAPAPGDSLIFSGSARLTANNNFGVDTNFATLTFSPNAGAFTLSGNRVTLAGNVTNNSTSPETISLGLALGASDRSFYLVTNSLLALSGPLSATSASNSKIKTFGPGTVQISGTWSDANVGFTASTNLLYFSTGANVTARTVILQNGAGITVDPGVTLSATGAGWSLGSANNGGTNVYTQTGGTVTASALTFANQLNTASLVNISGGSLTVNGTLTFGSRGYTNSVNTIMNVNNAVVTTVTFAFGDAASNFGPGENEGAVANIGAGGQLIATTALDWGVTGASFGGTRVTSINLNGGLLSTVATKKTTPAHATSTFTVNGGILQARNASANFLNGLDNFYVQAGGITIDSQANNITIAQNLQEDTGSTGGGLIKIGSGTLTLGNFCSYTGPTIVSNGVLAVGGDISSSSLVALRDGTDLQISPAGSSTINVNALTVGSSAAGAKIDFGFSSGANDAVNVTSPAGLTLNGGALYLYYEGTALPFSSPGTYPLFNYNTSFTGNLTALSIGNPRPGKIYTLSNDVADKEIILTIATDPSLDQWKVDADGNWSSAGNWSLGVPNSAGALAVFSGAITSPRTVTVDVPITVGSLDFDNINNAYTITGPSLLTLDNLLNPPVISVDSGSHVISAPLQLNANTLMGPSVGTTLTLAADINGAGTSVIVTNGGIVQLTGTNYTGSIVKNGTLVIADEANLGPNPGVANPNQLVVDGGVLENTLSFAIDDPNRGVTLGANNGTFSPDLGTILTVVNPIQGVGGLIKAGAGTVQLTAPNTYTGTTTISAGELLLGDGTNNGTLGGGAVLMSNGTLGFDGSSDVVFNKNVTRTANTPQISNFGTNLVTLTGLYTGGSGGLAFDPETGNIVLSPSAPLAGFTSFIKNGAGELQVNGSATIATSTSGALAIHGGTLAFGNGANWTVTGARAAAWFVSPNGNPGTLVVSNGANVSIASLLMGGPNTLDSDFIDLEGGTLNCTLAGGQALNLHDGPGFYTSTVTINSGTLNVSAAGGYLSIGLRGDANFNLNNGAVNADCAGFGQVNGSTALAAAANCTLTISNGVFSSVSQFETMRDLAVTASRVNTISLDGGALRTVAMNCSTPGGTVIFNFDGGKLVALGNATAGGVDSLGNVTNFLKGVNLANVQAQGAFIDSSNFNVVITNALVEDTTSTGGGLVKLGTGSLTLPGVSTYSGGTLVSNGTLRVNGRLNGTGAVTVLPGSTLGGSGTITGDTTLNSGATLSPGSSVGILTFAGSLTLNSGASASFELNRTNAGATNDSVVVSGTLNLTGSTLTVTNVGTALVSGDRFQLFNKAAGGFTTVTLPAGYNWNNNLASDGSISVASVVSATPPSFSGAASILPDHNISLTATGDIGTTFTVWTTTNLAATPIATTWSVLTNGTVTTSPFTITDATATNYSKRFYLFSTP